MSIIDIVDQITPLCALLLEMLCGIYYDEVKVLFFLYSKKLCTAVTYMLLFIFMIVKVRYLMFEVIFKIQHLNNEWLYCSHNFYNKDVLREIKKNIRFMTLSLSTTCNTLVYLPIK